MVGSLDLLLLSDTGLLKKVRHNVATSELSRSGKMDSDKLSEPGKESWSETKISFKEENLEELSFLAVLALP